MGQVCRLLGYVPNAYRDLVSINNSIAKTLGFNPGQLISTSTLSRELDFCILDYFFLAAASFFLAIISLNLSRALA